MKQLQEEVEFLRTVYQGVNHPIFAIDVLPDGDFRYVGWNAAAKTVMGMKSQDIIGKTPEEIYGVEVGTFERQQLQKSLEAGESTSYERCLIFAGKESWWMTTHNPVKDSNGKVFRFISTMFDISDRRKSEAELVLAMQELQRNQAEMVQAEKMSSLGQLVMGIIQQIGGPVGFIHGNIAYIKAYTQDLLELIALYQQAYPNPTDAIADKIEGIDLEFITADLSKSLASMQVATERIREVFKSLRLFSGLDKAEVQSVNIHDGIDSTLTLLQSRIQAQSDRAEIQIIKDYGNLPLVECFAAELNQVFMNILSNAIDALEARDRMRSLDRQNQHPSTIRITTEMTANHQVCIRIADNGIGISEDIKHRIFDPFFTTKPVGKGTGMGMSISYQIVTEKHGGKLSCHSIPGQGTEFAIQIPIKTISTGSEVPAERF